MILKVYGYGHPVLTQEAEDISKDYPNLKELIANMYETMYAADGVGIAAPQVGLGIRLFLVDTVQTMDEEDKDKGIKGVFINADIIEEEGKKWQYEEGCLSIPKVVGDVSRQPRVRIQYYDENFKFHDEWHEGINGRVIQHEYDHIDGVLFTELLGPIKRRRIKKKLERIKTGDIEVDYQMKFHAEKPNR